MISIEDLCIKNLVSMATEFSFSELTVVETLHGGIMAIYEGYEYMKHYVGEDHITCRCTKQKEHK